MPEEMLDPWLYIPIEHPLKTEQTAQMQSDLSP